MFTEIIEKAVKWCYWILPWYGILLGHVSGHYSHGARGQKSGWLLECIENHIGFRHSLDMVPVVSGIALCCEHWLCTIMYCKIPK